jgi:hypothetical protein
MANRQNISDNVKTSTAKRITIQSLDFLRGGRRVGGMDGKGARVGVVTMASEENLAGILS